MVFIAYLVMLLFCAASAFMIMVFAVGRKNVREEEKDPAGFLMGKISYEEVKEFVFDYRENLPRFMSLYGYDRKAFPDDESGSGEDADSMMTE